MATSIVMPQMGFDMKQAKLLRWLKKEGDRVEKGETIAEIETDKAVLEVEAFSPGILGRIVAPEGEVVPVGRTIAVVVEPGEAVPAGETLPSASPAARAAPAPRAEAAPQVPSTQAVSAEEGLVKASPAARRLAREKGADLAQVRGTGPEGRITEKDVEAHVSAVAATAPDGKAAPVAEAAPPVSAMRQAIARRMTQSKREAPHFYITMEIDMGAAMSLRHEINLSLSAEERLTVTDMILKAIALALRQFPSFNAYFLDGQLRPQTQVNVGLAIALEDGLIAPALLDADRKPLVQIAKESKSLAERARSGRLKPEEYSQATFTLTNLGMFEVDTFQAIINPPHVAILALGTVRAQPVVKEGRIVIAQMMKATLSSDHRAVDGAQAARFLGAVRKALEAPASLLG